MKRVCPHCGLDYDTKKESAMWCHSNPRREENLRYRHKTWMRKRRGGIVRIGVVVVPPNPFRKRAGLADR